MGSTGAIGTPAQNARAPFAAAVAAARAPRAPERARSDAIATPGGGWGTGGGRCGGGCAVARSAALPHCRRSGAASLAHGVAPTGPLPHPAPPPIPPRHLSPLTHPGMMGAGGRPPSIPSIAPAPSSPLPIPPCPPPCTRAPAGCRRPRGTRASQTQTFHPSATFQISYLSDIIRPYIRLHPNTRARARHARASAAPLAAAADQNAD